MVNFIQSEAVKKELFLKNVVRGKVNKSQKIVDIILVKKEKVSIIRHTY